MIEVSRNAVPAGFVEQFDVTFRLPARPEIATVAVVGDFNGWSPTTLPMQADGDEFTASVRLQGGRRYRFKYLVNGDRWENDWAADDYAPNAAGGDDSILDLVHPHQRRFALTDVPATSLAPAPWSGEAPRPAVAPAVPNARRDRLARDRRGLAEVVELLAPRSA